MKFFLNFLILKLFYKLPINTLSIPYILSSVLFQVFHVSKSELYFIYLERGNIVL